MQEYQNISLEIVNFLIPFLVGSLIFFSLVVAPNVFIALDQKSARKFIRSIFPKLYLYAFLISIAIAFLIIYHGTIYSVLFFLVSFGFLFSKIFLVKWINDVSDVKQKTSKQIKKFKILHSLSVLIFITQIVCMTIVYFKVQ
tara:strand:+ start:387 stop:812 length:426 start_codon:yes stop_codon:yes gene_type:complete